MEHPASLFTVLVVDDNPAVLKVLTGLLRLQGALVVTAADGPEAARLLRRRTRQIDAAIIDLRMPKMGGEATADLLHDIVPGLPCCLSSGERELIPSPPEGFLCLLGKPFQAEELRECLLTLLGAAQTKAAPAR